MGFVILYHVEIFTVKLIDPVQMLYFCHAELNSRIKFHKSMAELRHLNQTFELSSASNQVQQALA